MATVTRRPIAGPRISTGAVGWGLLLVLTAIGLTWGIRSNTCPSNLGAWVGFAVTGFRLGSIYAMIALGYTMVYGVLQLLNFAHSEVFMIGAFAGLYTFSSLFGITNHNPPHGIGGP